MALTDAQIINGLESLRRLTPPYVNQGQSVLLDAAVDRMKTPKAGDPDATRSCLLELYGDLSRDWPKGWAISGDLAARIKAVLGDDFPKPPEPAPPEPSGIATFDATAPAPPDAEEGSDADA